MIKGFGDVVNYGFLDITSLADGVHGDFLQAGVKISDEAEDEEFVVIEFGWEGEKVFHDDLSRIWLLRDVVANNQLQRYRFSSKEQGKNEENLVNRADN